MTDLILLERALTFIITTTVYTLALTGAGILVIIVYGVARRFFYDNRKPKN